MIKITEGGFSEMWIGNKPPELQAISYAIQKQVAAVVESAGKTSCYAGVDSLPEEALDYFAVELRSMYYDVHASLQRKREIIKNTLAWYAKNGTAGALLSMLTTAFDSASVEEWFDYNGDPFHFNVVLMTEWSEKVEEAARDAISKTKNVRSVLDNLVFRVESSPANMIVGSAVSGMEIVLGIDIMSDISMATEKTGTAVTGIEIVNTISTV